MGQFRRPNDLCLASSLQERGLWSARFTIINPNILDRPTGYTQAKRPILGNLENRRSNKHSLFVWHRDTGYML